ncbi:site-2 protease family protein [Quadrisphaera sp. DSM 44207]|uniref:site-2 protease family protein n=1 Tax=Quadrisphaera sp. DSM 44207 TaxID=1881057 RepID=UPI000887982F|nr:site-2 protease family protein [Quadrisphaera sp. DSM 44207]SDQ40578.1 Zn-dependent protease (includes SpoIVFB) [Quadrisphaera sp. DSM 44207]
MSTSAPGTAGAAERPEGWRIGTLLGVPVLVARSWFVIAAVVTWTFAPLVASTAPQLGALRYAVAFGYALVLCLSVLVHELAHAATARAFGIPASRIVLTLWGGHTQFEHDPSSPGRSFAVAVAGPASNAALAGGAWAALAALDPGPVARLLLVSLALTNAFVAVTNVLPGLPLDGGRLLEAVVWRTSGDRELGTIVAAWVGRAVAVGVLVAALGWPWLTGGGVSLVTVVVAAAIGALLWTGAGAALQGARIRRRAPSASVAALARPAVAVPAGASLAAALQRSGQVPGGAWVVLVDAAGAPSAVLDPVAVADVPEQRRDAVAAASAARALPPGAVVASSLRGEDLLRALSAAPAEEWVALDAAGRVSGLLLARDVVAAVMGPRAAARR